MRQFGYGGYAFCLQLGTDLGQGGVEGRVRYAQTNAATDLVSGWQLEHHDSIGSIAQVRH